MIIELDDPLSDYVEGIFDTKTGKRVAEAGVLLRTWDTVKKQGLEVRVKNTLLLETFTHIPSGQLIMKVPKEKTNLIEKLSKEQGVEVIVS